MGRSECDRQKGFLFHIIDASISGYVCPKFVPTELSDSRAQIATRTPSLDGRLEARSNKASEQGRGTARPRKTPCHGQNAGTRPSPPHSGSHHGPAPSSFPESAACFKLAP